MRPLPLVALAALSALGCHSSTDVPATCEDLKAICGDSWNATLRTTAPGVYGATLRFADGATSQVTCTLPGTTCTSSDAGVHASVDAAGIELGAVRASSSFTLTLARDGVVVLTKTFVPTYAPYHPNGGDCPPTCAAASDALDVP